MIGVLETTAVKLETEAPLNTEKKPNFLQRVLLSWDGFLRTFRLFLPSNISNNLSDLVLTEIFAVIAVGIIGITIFMFNYKPTEVIKIPAVEEVTVPIPMVIVSPTPEPIKIPETTPEPELTKIPETSPEVIKTPKTIEIPETIQIPVRQFTPEETLISSIEKQFSEISVSTKSTEGETISSKLIKSIQANFRSGDLIIKISDVWFTLEKSQQNQLAADIFQRSQELDFTHLEIVDSQNNLVARSPAVGDKMVIFKRINSGN
jgi:hypothetical protein